MVRRDKLKGAVVVCGITLWLAQSVIGAFAFSEEPVAPPAAQAAPPAKITPQIVQPQAAQMVDPLSQATKPKGTELTIPGIGSVGTFPKLDFGLELLYGSQNAPQPNGLQIQDQPPLDQHDRQDDVQIKGTLKHKF